MYYYICTVLYEMVLLLLQAEECITYNDISSRNLQVFLSHLTCILLICGSLGNAEAETVSSTFEKCKLRRLWFRNSVRDTLCLLSGLVLLLFWKVLPIHIRLVSDSTARCLRLQQTWTCLWNDSEEWLATALWCFYLRETSIPEFYFSFPLFQA